MRVTGTTPEYLVGVLVPPRSTIEGYGYYPEYLVGGLEPPRSTVEGYRYHPGAPGGATGTTAERQEGTPGLMQRVR